MVCRFLNSILKLKVLFVGRTRRRPHAVAEEHHERTSGSCAGARQTSVMTRATGACDVTQNRAWNNRRFRVWVAGGALRGALLHQSNITMEGGEVVVGLLLCHLLGVSVSLAPFVGLPLAFLRGTLSKRKQEAMKQHLNKLDPLSEQFLGWDERNFCLRFPEIKGVAFSGKARGMAWSPKGNQRMKVQFQNGQTWQFTFADRLDAGRLEQALRAEGVTVSRLERSESGLGLT